MTPASKPKPSVPPRTASGVRLAVGAATTTCRDVMMKRVFGVPPFATLADAAKLMRDEGIGFVVVHTRSRAVLGVLTDRDIVVRACAEEREPARSRVSDIMSSEVLTCHVADPLEAAVSLMEQHQKSRVVVLDEEGALAGVISYSDVVQSVDPIRMARFVRHLTARDYRVRGTRAGT